MNPTTMRRSFDRRKRCSEGSTAHAGPIDRGLGRTARRSPFCLLPIRGGTVGTAFLLAAAVIGLAQVDSRSAGPHPESEGIEPPGSGTIIASEVLHLRIPETLAGLAVRRSQSCPIRTHEDLRRTLEDLDQRDLWYAVTIGCLQANGVTREMTFIRRPYDEPQHFHEVEFLLARAGGTPECDDAGRFATAAVRIIPDELAGQGPSWLIARLSRPAGGDVQSDSP